MNIVEYKPLLIIYFNDPIEDVSLYTIPLENKAVFLDKLANSKYVEIEGIILRTIYIVKCEPLEIADPIKYSILTSPYHIRAYLINRNKEVPFNSVEHLNNYINHLLWNEKAKN